MIKKKKELDGSELEDRMKKRLNEGEGLIIVGKKLGDEKIKRRRIGLMRKEERIEFGMLSLSGRGKWDVCNDGRIWRILEKFESGKNEMKFREVKILKE